MAVNAFPKAAVPTPRGVHVESTFLLDVRKWTNVIVGQLSPSIHIDAADQTERLRSEDQFTEEVEWGAYMGVPAIVGPELSLGENANYASLLLNLIARGFTGPYWVPVDMGDPTDADPLRAWRRWSQFHALTGYSAGIQPLLRLSATPLMQWSAEPLDTLLLPASCFVWLDAEHVTLPDALVSFLRRPRGKQPFRIAIEGALDEECQKLRILFNYLSLTLSERVNARFAPYCDVPQLPLQPLRDDLSSATYDVFEQDGAKYRLYQAALEEVFRTYRRATCDDDHDDHDDGMRYPRDASDRSDHSDHSDSHQHHHPRHPDHPLIITLIGAGRGPLILCSLRAARAAHRRIFIQAVEKNAHALVTLRRLHRELRWGETVLLLPGDGRTVETPYRCDVLLSELLGSLGDNELAPECLCAAKSLLFPGGVCIPAEHTSFLAPCMSTRIFSNVQKISPKVVSRPLEATYVVYANDAKLLAGAAPLFSFQYPDDSNGDFRRSKTIAITVEEEGVVHGFSGFFSAVLSDHVVMSIEPKTHSEDMNSWFPLFLPIETPFHVKKGDVVVVQVWRRCEKNRVWYEWAVTAPIRSTVHNVNGKGQSMGL